MRSTHRPLQKLHWWAILAVFFCGCTLRFVQMGHRRQTSLMTVIPTYLDTWSWKPRRQKLGRGGRVENLMSKSGRCLLFGWGVLVGNAMRPKRRFAISVSIWRRVAVSKGEDGILIPSLASMEGLSNGCTLLRIMKRTLAANVFRIH